MKNCYNNFSQIFFLALLAITLMFPFTSKGQQETLLDIESSIVKKYELEVDENGWVYCPKKPHINQLIKDIVKNKKSFGLNSQDALKTKDGFEMGFISKWDDSGLTRFNQTHNGLNVEGAQLSIHYDNDGNVKLMHGKLGTNLPSDKSVAIDEGSALKIALSVVQAHKYAWESEQWEEQLKLDTENPHATYYPSGELMYARLESNRDFDQKNYRLSYRFEMKTLEPFDQIEVIIDAKNGSVIRKQSMIHHAWGTVNTLYNGQHGFVTYWRGFPNYDYVLKDHTRGEKLHTLRWSDSTPWIWRSECDDSNNIWNTAGATTHWAVQVTWDYFKFHHNRNGMDNSGGKIRIEAESSQVDAHYVRDGGYDYITFGRSPNGINGSLAALDIVGHEFTHGVTRHTSNLIYQGESGALNESFSDIFGLMVEQYLEGAVNWTVGEDADFLVRSLENPNFVSPITGMGSPDTFEGVNWIDPQSIFDHGGVHFNSGVQNFWFFLLANGGVGVNDLGQNYNVQGIGLLNAARIAFRNLVVYMQPSSNFADARTGAINAARDLFGECSQQFISTMNAWQAVGVGPAAPALCVTQINPNGASVCLEYPYSITFNVSAFPAAATVTWQVPPHWNFTVNNNGRSLTVNNYAFIPGSYTVSATASFAGQSIVRNSFVDVRYCYEGCPDPNVPCESRIAIQDYEEDETEVKIFPNPASSRVFILPRREENLLTIVDALGRTVIKRVIYAGENIVETASLQAGVYTVIVTNGNGRWIEKLIIKH